MHVRLMKAASVGAALVPVMAAAQATAPLATPRVPAAAEECLRDLRAFNRELVETGYGVPGPRGYGTAGFATFGSLGLRTPVATPRGEMRSVLTAAQVFAVHGDEETCQAILEGARELHQDRIEQIQALGIPPEEVMTWQAQRLTSAVPVTEIAGRAQIGELVGADVRNPAGEDLGDVEDVVLGPEGEVRYVLVSRGGFLGLGGEVVPVRWEDLRITPEPLDDTLVLDVREDQFENAPAIDEDMAEALAGDTALPGVDRYWDTTLER